MKNAFIAALAVVLLGAAASCSTDHKTSAATSDEIATIEVAHEAGLHNVFILPGGVINGSAPLTESAFAALEEMGVKTVISVDGATPEIGYAREHGMRYVHIPFGYDDVSQANAEQLALAMRDLPRPIYVHCFHGKHRGPAAIAVGMVCVGEMTNDEAVSFLELAGTSSAYSGLFASAERAREINWDGDDRRGEDLPEVVKVAGFVESMSRIGRTWDQVKVVRASNWGVPQDHPDLVPAAEAGMLVDLFRASHESGYAVRPGAVGAMVATADEDDMMVAPTAQMTFDAILNDAVFAATELENAIVDGNRSAAERWYARVNASCSECHTQFRN